MPLSHRGKAASFLRRREWKGLLSAGEYDYSALQLRFMLESEFHQAVNTVQIELRADVEPVVFDRARAQAEIVGNFLAGFALGDETQNALLGRRQVRQTRLGAAQ